MAGKNKKTESDFIKEIEAYEQQKKEAMEQLKAYQKSQTDKLGQIYFELKKLENPDLSIDDLVVETHNKVKEVKKKIKRRKAEEKARKDAEKTNKETYNHSGSFKGQKGKAGRGKGRGDQYSLQSYTAKA